MASQALTTRIATRLRVLRAVYELVDGHRHHACSPAEIGERAGVEPAEVDHALVYLQDEGLVRHVAEDYVEIAHQGITEYEATLREPTESTEHFPAPVILNVTATNIGAIVSGNENTTSIQQQHNQGISAQELVPMLDRLASQVQSLQADEHEQAAPALARIRGEMTKATPAWDKVTASLKYLESFTKLAGVVKAILALLMGTPG